MTSPRERLLRIYRPMLDESFTLRDFCEESLVKKTGDLTPTFETQDLFRLKMAQMCILDFDCCEIFQTSLRIIARNSELNLCDGWVRLGDSSIVGEK